MSLDAIAAECDYLLEQETAAAASTISSDGPSVSPASVRATRSKRVKVTQQKKEKVAPAVQKERKRQEKVKPKKQTIAIPVEVDEQEDNEVATLHPPPARKRKFFDGPASSL